MDRRKNLTRRSTILLVSLLTLLSADAVFPAKDDNQAKILFSVADNYLKDEDYASAVRQFSKFLSLYPGDLRAKEARYKLGEAHYKKGDVAQAIKAYENVVKMHPNDELGITARNRIGDGYQRLGEFKKAVIYYEDVHKNYPDSNQAGYAKYSIEWCNRILGREKPVEVETVLKDKSGVTLRIEKDKIKAESEKFIDEGKKLFASQKYAEAMDKFKDYLKKYPKRESAGYAQFKIGESNYYLKKYPEALENYKNAISLYPERSDVDYVLYSMGWTYSKMNDMENAAAEFKNLVDNYPKSPYAQDAGKRYSEIAKVLAEKYAGDIYDIAKRLYDEGNLAEAKIRFDEITAKFPGTKVVKNAEFMSKNVELLLAKKRKEEAKKQYELASKFHTGKEYDRAITEYQKLIRTYPEQEYTPLAQKSISAIAGQISEEKGQELLTIAKSKYADGNYDEAMKQYQKVLMEYPKTKAAKEAEEGVRTSVEMVNNINAVMAIAEGERHVEKGDYERAAQEFSKVLDEYFNSSYAKEAESKLSMANSLMYDDKAKEQYDLAKRYYELGDANRALTEFKKITVTYPNSSYAKSAKEYVQELSVASAEASAQDKYDIAFEYYQRRDYKNAINLLQEVLLKHPDSKQAESAKNLLIEIDRKYNDKKADESYILAGKYYENGEFGMAKDEYEKILKNSRDSKRYPYALYGVAECYYCMGDYNSAVIKWNELINVKPEESIASDAAFHIADSYEKMNMWKSAKNAYLFLLENYPKSKYMAGELKEMLAKKLDNVNYKLASEGIR